MPTDGELSLRLLIAAALAGALGAERELTEQPAGMRTHILLGLGAALFAIVSAYGFEAVVAGSDDRRVNVDVSRVAAQIASGIGFIGGGAILKYGANIRGLTTAASLWVTAAIGTAVGVGLLLVSVVTTAIVLIALVGLLPVRSRLQRRALPRHDLVVEVDRGGDLGAVLLALEDVGVAAADVRMERAEGSARLMLYARLPRGVMPAVVAQDLSKVEAVRDVDWS